MDKKKKVNPTQEYLKQIKTYDVQIENKSEEVLRMNDLAIQITAALKPVVVSGGGGGKDKVGDAGAEIVDLVNELHDSIRGYREKKREITSLIDLVKDPDELDMLQKRYVLHKTLEQAANEMHVSYRNACNIHGRALKSVEALMKEREAYVAD